jgi:hypothetical protein
VPVNERVYKINVYADDPEVRGLDARSKELLSDVRFEPPSRSVGSLDLPDANSPEALFSTADPGLIVYEEAEHRTAIGEDETARISAAHDANGGVYAFGRKRKSDNTCRASIVCGKGYFISN